ncbi:hypothetical protein Btru_011815 [Bulinus truncatus]|nr:hypothetical protein Btru_011815 [Bulinus truncatus]
MVTQEETAEQLATRKETPKEMVTRDEPPETLVTRDEPPDTLVTRDEPPETLVTREEPPETLTEMQMLYLFEDIKTLLRQIVSHWDIGPNKIRVGIISYGDGVHVESRLIDSFTASDVYAEINSLRYFNAPADVTDALKKAVSEAFLPVNGGRAGEREIIIHIGAGTGSDPVSHANEVKIANEKGIIVYNVALGDGWLFSKLSDFSSQPPSRYSLPVVNFSLLDPQLASTIAYRVQNGCLSKADVVICLDGSTSVTAGNFLRAKENLKTLIPTGCKLEKLASDCCAHISCPLNTVIIPSTTNLLGPLAGTNIYVISATGQQKPLLPVLNPDGSVNTAVSAYQTATVKGCLFNGQVLSQGEAAKNGNCGYTCQCLNETTGLMACIPRCPTYAPKNDLCTVVTDPFDACCKVPSCPLSVYNPPKPTYSTPTYTYGVVKGPDPHVLLAVTTTVGTTYATGGTPTSPPTTAPRTTFDTLHFYRPQSANALPTFPPGIVPNPNTAGYCTHKETGINYREGARWTVGCQYNCLCLNGATGSYVCSNMCIDLHCPTGYNCTHYPDPEFPCCNLLQINLPSNTEIHPTILSTGKTCQYNGKEYHVGQSWQEGCDRNCTCSFLNANTVYTQSKDFCPKYISLPPGCNEVQVQGSCCPILVGSTCSGQYCLDLNQNTHLPGESWREGCEYDCTCIQKPDGFYRECRGICLVSKDLEKFNCTYPTPAPGKCCALPDCCIDANCQHKLTFEITDQF